MTWCKSEEEVDKIIADMSNRIKGNYITQGVAFNKTCPRQMKLLKNSLMSSASFSGFVKEMLAIKFEKDEGNNQNQNNTLIPQSKSIIMHEESNQNRDVGNFF